MPLAFVDDLNGIAKCGFDSIALNTFITTQIELKKLRFHVADKKGKSKCVKMHVGKNHENCPVLKVHGTIMPEVTEEKYLGDILSFDGKNSKNIKDRISKGIGIISQILNLLEMISFGPHHFEIAMLLRDSMLVNGTTTNAEIWYNFSDIEIKEFENLDHLFFRKLLEVPRSTPTESFFLELGVLPINVIIKARRVNYLHSILSGNKSGMLYSFFITQWHTPSRGDWTEAVKKDLNDFHIPCSFDFIIKKSKEAFKRLVKVKAKEFAIQNLKTKKETHSKLRNLAYDELKMQNYLTCEETNICQKKLLFKYRTRMETFGENFRGGNGPVPCPLCHLHLDNEEMSFQCQAIKSVMEIKGNIQDIYQQNIRKETVETITKISKYRKQILEN